MPQFRTRVRKNRCSRQFRLLEQLDVRALLSAVISVSGHGVNITSGDTTPALTDFTDYGYMSTTVTAAIGTITRRYVITNTGDADLNLTGVTNLVSLTGADASDFNLVVDASAPTLTAGATTSFTISFIPQASGVKSATVTIPSDDPTTPSFTFDIRGTGLITTNATDGLQTATITSGTGSAAIVGSHLLVNYTGYLTTGEIFDSSDPNINSGRTPFSLFLGRHGVIDGWEEGLVGIAQGETRALIIPSDLAYGPGGSGDDIPGNAPLIFVVTAEAVDMPAITIKGNSVTIAPGDSTPSTADFTDFGGMSTTNTLGSVTRLFVINNTSSADLFLTGSPDLVTISGADAANFAVVGSPGSKILAGGTSNFRISFVPTTAGEKHATVTVASSDPNVPSFSFDIQGTGLITTNSSDGLMISSQGGTGTPAETGSRVSLTFTGTLFDGTIFDSATNSGSPLMISIGDPTQIVGLNEGLLGIQPGETRTIIVPSSLGYGATSHGNIPANSPLIYNVIALSVGEPASVIVIKGNGNTITPGSTTSSLTNFTDFGMMSTTRSSLIGMDTRTYTLQNIGAEDLILSGGVKAILISGPNKGDFSLVTPPSGVIDGFSSSTFTLAFQPQGTGLRRATVTVISNDPSTPVFTFAIQGTGVTTTTTKTGLLIATPNKGTGPKAIIGADLTVNYTGTLMDGTIFDSSLDTGRSPLELNIGIGEVIPGWDETLIGARSGETFFVMIPAAQAYGASSHGNVPPNAPLMFSISVLTVTNPAIKVTGNGQAVTTGDLTPSTSNGTAVATAIGSSAPINLTFVVSSSTSGLTTFPDTPQVSLKPKTSKNFAITGFNNNGSTSTLTVTYTPTKEGTQDAVVHIYSADLQHPDFLFKVAGTYTKFVDLQATEMGEIDYPFPGTVISGSPNKYTVPVTITNLGNAPVGQNAAPVSFDFYMRNLATNTDVLVSSQTSTALRGLGIGKKQKLSFNVPIISTVPTGNYEMKLVIDNHSVSQYTNHSNDTLVSSVPVLVTQGFNNLLGVLTSSTVPLSIAHNAAATGKLNVQVQNGGNLTLPANQKVNVKLIARPTGGGADVILKSQDVSVASLAPGDSTSVSLGNLGTVATAGTYQLVVQLTPVQTLTERSTLDNLISTNATGGTYTLTVT